MMKAVILAGGRGERIRPISDTLPKALVPIDGKPILAHQIAQLERIGIQELFILTGYLAKSIASYCKQINTSMVIHCIESNPDATPAQRLLNSYTVIGDEFLLIYCDNFVSSDFEIISVLNNKADITFLVQARKIGNVKITSNHRAFYNSDKRNSEYQLVELGNISIKTPKFMLSLQTTQDLPKTLEQLSEELQCSAITSESSFKSISNFETYIKNLQGRKIVLLDRDGILIKKMPHRKYLSNMKDYNPIYENWNCLKEISRLGVDFIIVTNQPGVATGEVSEEFVTETHVKLVSDLLNYGINILSVYVCKHHWDENCDCRKPKPGMLLRAMQAFEIDPSLTLYIGDELKDCLAASSAGVDYVIINRDLKGQFIYNNLAEAMPIIHSKLFKLH